MAIQELFEDWKKAHPNARRTWNQPDGIPFTNICKLEGWIDGDDLYIIQFWRNGKDFSVFKREY